MSLLDDVFNKKKKNKKDEQQENKKVSTSESPKLPTQNKKTVDSLPYGVQGNNFLTNTRTTSNSNINTASQTKNQNTWDNVVSFLKNVGRGTINSFGSAHKYAENITEIGNSNYKDSRERQFYTSPYVSMADKIRLRNAQNQYNTNIIKAVNNNDGRTVEEKIKGAINKTKEENKDRVFDVPETNLSKKIADDIQKNQQNKMALETEKATGDISRFLIGDVAPSMGQNLVQHGLSLINPALGIGFTTMSAGGSYFDEAKQRGMSDKKALLYSAIGAGVEGATEAITFENVSKAGKGIGNLIKTGSFKTLEDGGEEVVKNTVLKALKDYGISVAEEGVQEFLTDPIMEAAADAIDGKGDWDNIWQRAFKSGLSGMISAGISGGATIGVQSCVSVMDKVTSGQQVSQKEMVKAYNDAIDNGVQVGNTNVDQSNNLKTNLQSMINNLNLSDESKQEIQSRINSDTNINEFEYNTIKNDIKEQVKANTEQQANNVINTTLEQYNQLEQLKQGLDNIKPETYQNQDYRKLYAQLVNETELEDPTYDKILTLYPTNKNGKRSLSDWQNIARDYGKAMAEEGRSFDEVRHNVVKAWLDEKPYDRQQTSKNGQKLPTQRWYPIDQFTKTAYDSYRDTMKPLITEQQKSLQANMESQVQAFKDEYDTIIDTIDNLGTQETQVTRSPEEVERTKKLVEDFAKNRGVKVEYNSDVFNNNNEEAFIKDNGKGDRTIYINPNADPDTILVKLATHEMFHDTIRTEPHDKLTKLVMDKLKADENYNTYRESVREAYQEQLEGKTQAEQDAIIDEEMTAKYLGEYLGDEQFVQQLVNSTNRTTIQRIMDWIDNRLQQIKNVVTGNKEAEYWRKVRENFEKAYNSKYQGQEGTHYNNKVESQEEGSLNLPKNVKDIKNTKEWLKKAIENETNHEWKERLKDASRSSYDTWTRRESPLKWRREIIQQYLDYKNEQNNTNVNDAVTIDGTEYEVKGKETSPYQRKIQKEWDIDNIQEQLKKEQSPTTPIKAELDKFDSFKEMKDNIYYHGSIGYNQNLKAGSTLREDQRTGGYGEAYHTISLSKNRNLASNFASMGSTGVVTPVLLRKDARVIKMDNVSDSIELEDYLPELWKNNIDAVELGEGSEEELVVLNPNAITVIGKGRTDFKNYGKPKFQNLNTEDLEALYQDYKEQEVSELKEKIDNETNEAKKESLQKQLDTLQKKSVQDIGTDNATYDTNTILTHEQLREFKGQVENEINSRYGDNSAKIYISAPASGFIIEVDNKISGEEFKQRLDTSDSKELFKQIRPILSELTQEAGFDVDNIINPGNQTANNTTTDNQGRTLTKEQQEYFKNESSEFKDSNGNLKRFYSGSSNQFTIFDATNQRIYGNNNVNFFTDNQDVAKSYGKEQYEVYIKSKNPYVLEGDTNGTTLEYSKTGKEELNNNNETIKTISEKLKQKISRYYNKSTSKVAQAILENKNNILSDNEINYLIDHPFSLAYLSVKAKEGFYHYSKPIMTNDVVNAVLRINEVTNDKYDAIMFKSIEDSGQLVNDNSFIKSDVVATFNSNQVKNIDNLNPTEDPDIRYNKKSTEYDEYLKANNPNRSGVTIGDLQQKLPTKQTQLPTTKKTQTIQQNKAEKTTANLPIQEDTITVPLETNENQLPSQKQRKAYQSIIESPVMSDEAKQVARKYIGQDTYIPDSNKQQLERADAIIKRVGVEKALDTLETNAMEGKRITADDIAQGDRLIQYYSLIGDGENLQRAVRAVAMAGTQAGRSVQAFNLLRHQSPEGMVVWIQNSVDKLNSKTKNGQFDFTPEMQQKIASSTEENLQQNVDEVMKELGQQVPVDTIGKIDAWRYFSMLANPKTHIRNIVGNFAMGLTQQVSNKIAGTIEQVTGQDRTHTSIFEKRSKENIQFAKEDLKNVTSQLGMGENKYVNPKNQIQKNQRTFKSDTLEKTLGKLYDLNDNLLEGEDNFGLKNAYIRCLSDYMTANKLKPSTITNEQLQQARKIAINNALEATFHQESSLASMLNQFENKNSLTRLVVGGLVPFKKTPINVAKGGFNYSPVGLAKSIVYDTVELRKGNINANQYIDNISKGLTGTGIAFLGYALAEAGILKASGDDDKEDKYKQAMGEQPYSIMINGKSYSLDWLAPSGIPLFVGAEFNKLVHNSEEKDGESQNAVLKTMARLTDATSSLLNPMSEMSMISGLTSTIQSFSQDSGTALMNLGLNPVKSYLGQFVPTALGQIARTTDKYERDTTTTENGMFSKAYDSLKNQVMNKIPGLRQMLPTKKDIWGEEIETQDYFHNAVLPYNKKEIKTNPVDKELNDLYEKTGENIYPNTSLSKTVTYEGSKTRLTNQDYNDFKTNYGKTSYKLLDNLISSKEYSGMTDEQKVKAVKDVYTYANNLNKTEYAEKKGIDFEVPNDVKQVRSIKANGGTESDYFKYKGLTDGLTKESEKMTALKDSSLSTKSKRAVYISTIGSDDTFYQNTNIGINDYLGYKTANIQGVKDSSGKTISGSKKQAQLDYINKNISGYENRLLLMGKDYKLSRSQQQDLANYINTLDNAEDLFSELSKNFTVSNGTVYYK